MSVKTSVRSVLPATNRFFEQKACDIHDQISSARDEAHSLHKEAMESIARVSDVAQAGLAVAGNVQDRVANLESWCNRVSYCNSEYLSLNREYTGRRILLAGWYGASNCGDELMMRTMLQHLEGRGARVSVLLWDDPDYDFSRLPLIADQIHYPRSTWELRQLAEYFDVLVWGGGAIIDERQFSHDPKNINTGNLFIWLSEEMQKRDKDVFAIGLSANESLRPCTEFAERLGRVVDRCRHVSLRDDYSYRVLKDAGVNVSALELCEDIVFGNRFAGTRAPASPGESPDVGVVLMMGDVTAEHNRRVLPRLVESVRERYGQVCRVKLIPFYNFWQFDATLLSGLCEELGLSDAVEIAPYTDDLQDLALLQCDVVVAYRYHACLVSAAAGVRTLFMCVDDHPHYRNKMKHIAEVFGMSDYLLMASSCLDDGSFDTRFDELLSGSGVPTVPDGLFDSTSRFLDGICESIVGACR